MAPALLGFMDMLAERKIAPKPRMRMRPFVEVDGQIFAVLNWDEDTDKYELRPLSTDELRMYEEIVYSAEIEAFAWVTAPVPRRLK